MIVIVTKAYVISVSVSVNDIDELIFFQLALNYLTDDRVCSPIWYNLLFSLSFLLIFQLLTFFSNNIFLHVLFALHWWFWGMLSCVKSLMISSLLFSLLKHVFIGHEIEVCTPMWFNRLLSPSTWSSAYFSSNSISVIWIWLYLQHFGDFEVCSIAWNHSWFHP